MGGAVLELEGGLVVLGVNGRDPGRNLRGFDHYAARFGALGRQGHHLGRPGFLQVTVNGAAGAVSSVRVAGAATIVYASTIELPASANSGSAR